MTPTFLSASDALQPITNYQSPITDNRFTGYQSPITSHR